MLALCNQVACGDANISTMQQCVDTMYPLVQYGILYWLGVTRQAPVITQDEMNRLTWAYLAIVGVALVLAVAVLPHWYRWTRSKNQWSNLFVYAAKVGVAIYALADPRQGVILSTSAFVGVLDSIHSIMESWYEFRRTPDSLYLHLKSDILTEQERALKARFEEVTGKLALVSYSILLSSAIGLIISYTVAGQCSVLLDADCAENVASEVWFMWVGFACSIAEASIEDDIYRIEISHADGFDQNTRVLQIYWKKIRQRVYCAALLLSCILGSAVDVRIHEFMSNAVMIAMAGFQRWIKIKITNSLAKGIVERRSSSVRIVALRSSTI